MNFPEKNVLGEGFKDLCRVLKGNDDFALETADMLFMQDGLGLQEQFKKSIKENFYAEVTQLDFAADSGAARTEINNWVKTETMDKIQDLIPEAFLGEYTKMVLVNAMYFKGDWVHQFAEMDTNKQSFYVNEDKSVEVDMMHNDRSKFKMYECKELQAKTIELPYKGDRVSMYVVLPNDKDGLNEVEEGLCRDEKLKEICSYTDDAQEKKLSLSLPKFKVEKTIQMMDRLMDLEMRHMFLQPKADFSDINGKKDLHVMDVIQKTFIDVNEYGSEAAAASGMGMSTTSLSLDDLQEFKCDRPFAFFLYDKMTDMMLFRGRVVDPTL
jgi:serpin B